MRLRKHMTALALTCAAAAGATSATFAQSPAPPKAQEPAPRQVEITPRPVEVSAQPNPQRDVDLYRAHFGGELTKAAYLGVSTSGVPAALRQHLGLPEGVGLVVDFVEDESPARAAGLKQYDILTKFDDQILVNGQQLAVLVRSRKANDDVKLTLVRGGKEQTLTARLVEKDVKPLNDIFWGVAADIDARVRELDERRVSRVPAAPQKPPTHNQKESGGRTMMVWRDNDMSLTITKNQDEEGRRLVVTDKSGKTIYQGNLDDKDDRAKLPPDVAEKVRQMESKQQPDKEPRGNANNPRGSLDFGGGGVEVQIDGSLDLVPAPQEKPGDDGDEEVEVEVEVKPSAKSPIGDNDLLNISIDDVYGHGVKTVKLARVRDGQVRLPYVPPVKCVGLTVGELEKQIATVYAKAKVAPKVNVRVRKVNNLHKQWTEQAARQ